MKSGQFYKHFNCIDVAVFVTKAIWVPNYLVCKVRWINAVNPSNEWDVGLPETIKIRHEDVKNWKLHGRDQNRQL